MKIHGAVYILVGLITTVVSAFLPNFGVFIIVGVVFMAIGIGKFIVGAKPKDHVEPIRHRQARVPNQQQYAQQRNYGQQRQNVQMTREQYEEYQRYQQFLAYKRMQQGRQQ